MSSKRFICKYLLCALTLLGFMACDDDKTVWLPADSSSLSSMAVQESMPKEGRSYLLACPLNLSEQATDVTVGWQNGTQEALPEDSCRDGISYKSFQWNEPGWQEVTCLVSYTYGDERKSLSVKRSFYVVPVFGEDCFAGDSKETVMQLHPGAELVNESSDYCELREDISSDAYAFYSIDYVIGLFTVRSGRVISQVDAPYEYMLKQYESLTGDEISEKRMSITFPEGIPDDMTDEEKYMYEALIKKIYDGQTLTSEESAMLNKDYLKGWIGFEIQAVFSYPQIGYSREYSLEYRDGKHCYQILSKRTDVPLT